jgi:hypothetical protein
MAELVVDLKKQKPWERNYDTGSSVQGKPWERFSGANSYAYVEPEEGAKKESLLISKSGEQVNVPVGVGRVFSEIQNDDTFDLPSTALEETGAAFEANAAFVGWVAASYGIVDPENISEFISDRSRALASARQRQPAYMKKFDEDFENAGFFEAVGLAFDNLPAMGRKALVSSANSAIPLVTGFAGAWGGAAAGSVVPVVGTIAGGVAGSVAGGFVGSAMTEVGAEIDGMVQEAGYDISDPQQVLAAMQDEDFMKEIRSKAERKGLTTAAVDAMFQVIGGKFTRKAFDGASSLAGKAAGVTADIGIQSVGEGVGEFAGQYAKDGTIDAKGALLEGLVSIGQSSGQTALGSAARKGMGFLPKSNNGADSEINIPPADQQPTAAAEIDIPPAQYEAEIDRLTNDLAQLEELSIDDLDERTRGAIEEEIVNKENRIFSIESAIDKREAEIQALQGEGYVPVPRPPKSLAKFIREKGGIKYDPNDKTSSGEARLLTRKENPQLRGVAKKTGKLTLDEAREYAVEAGYLQDDGEFNGVSQSSIQDLLDALDSEASGNPIYSQQDQDVVTSIDQANAYNTELAQVNEEMAKNAKKLTTLRESFRDGVRAARKDVKAVQSIFIDILEKSGLDAKDRAKFIKKIKNTQTVDQLNKSIPDIEKRVSNLLDADTKRNLRDKIKKIISSARKTKNITPELKDEIMKLEERLSETGVLGSGMNDTSVEAFQEAFIEAQTLLTEGQAKLQLKKQLKEQRHKQRLELLATGTRKFSNINKNSPLGQRLTIFDRVSNIINDARNRAQRLGLNKLPMDVIFDVLDGAKNYLGPNSTVFKKPVDRAFGAYLNLKEKTSRPVKELADKFKMGPERYDMIGAWAVLQQDGGEKRLLNSGITKEEIAMLDERYGGETVSQEASQELEMYEEMVKSLDGLRSGLRRIMSDVYNKDFKGVKNYFPFMTDFKSMDGFEINQMFGDDVILIGEPEQKEFNKKDIKKGFTKERVGGGQKVRIDAMDVFLNHVDNATYLIEMGQIVKELGEVAQSQEYRDLAGNEGQAIVSDWINLLARKGNTSQRNDFIDQFRINAGAAVLGFKLSSALIQPTALLDGAALVGSSYVSRGVRNIALSRDWRKFLIDHVPELRQRAGDDQAYLDMGGKGNVAKFREAGFWALQKLDLLAASAVAAGAYTRAVEEAGGKVDFQNPDPVAIEYAQLMMRRTQSSSFAKDSPPIISQGKLTGNVSIDKLILQFQSFMLNRWSIIQNDIFAAAKTGRTKSAMNAAAFLILANIAEHTMRQWTREGMSAVFGYDLPEEDEDEAEKIVALQAISNVPFVSSAVNSAEYGSIPVPAISLVENVFDSLQYAAKSKSSDKKTKHYTQAGIMAAGSVLGIPGSLQAKQLSNALFSDDEPSNKESVLNP